MAIYKNSPAFVTRDSDTKDIILSESPVYLFVAMPQQS